MADQPFIIVEAIYAGMTQLDFTAPHTVFSRLPATTTIVGSEPGGMIELRAGSLSPGQFGYPKLRAATCCSCRAEWRPPMSSMIWPS